MLVAAAALVGPMPHASAAAPVTVSLVFNDGLSSQFRNAAPALQARSMDGTFYVASNWVKTNDSKYMRFYHLDELYRQGNEIGGMGKDHKNLTSTYDADPAADLAYKRDQVCGDFQALTTWGYHPVSFAYPGSAENATVQGIVRDCGFTTGRVAGGLSATGPAYAEPIPATNSLRLRSATTPAGAMTLQTLQNAVTAAGNNGGGWLPLAFNDVCSSTDASYSTCMNGSKPIDAAVFASFLDWLASQAPEGVTVKTVRQVMAADQPPLPSRPFVVSLTFDDGLRSQYGLREIFARHNVHGTFYINSGPVDAREAGTMSWAQIRDLQGAGHDIGGHTRDHINMLATDTSLEFKTRQTCDDRQRLLEEGINAVSFAYPFGAMDATAQPIVRGCGYQSGRKAGTVTSDGPIYSETIPVTENPYAIRILGTNYNGAVTLEALQYAVNQATKYGGSWLPTLFHQICYAGTPTYDSCMAGYRPIDDVTIDAFLGWLGSQTDRNITVKTVADVMGGGSTAPVVRVTAPAAGSVSPSGQPVLSGTASGNGNVAVRLYQGDYSTGTPVATLSAPVTAGAWSVEPGTALPDGSYTVQASQAAGNATGTSVPTRFTVDTTKAPTDTTAPEVSVTSPSAGATLSTSTPSLEGTAGTATGDGSEVTVRVFEGSVVGGSPAQTLTATATSGGAWSTTASALADGVYTVEATQADQAGNTGRSSAVTFTVDTTRVDSTAPSVTIDSPVADATLDTATPVLRGTAGTATGDDADVVVSISPSSETQGDAVQTLRGTVGSDGTWSVTAAALADGTYTAQATQSDAAGNGGVSNSVTFTVSTAPADTTAPAVTLTAPTAGATVVTADVPVAGGAGAEEGDDATVSLEVYTGSSATGTPTQRLTAAAASGAWSTNVTGLAAGTYTLVAAQSDAAGNVGRSQAVTFTKAVVPTITSISPTTLGQGATSTTVRINGSGFNSSTAAAISGAGVTSSVVSRTSTVVTLNVTVGAAAATQPRNVTVTNSTGATTTCTGCLSIVAGPSITGVSPTSVRRGLSTTVTITGARFPTGNGNVQVAVSGTGITVGTVRVVSSTTVTAVLQVSSTAALTARSLTLTNRTTFGSATRSNAVTVVP